MSANRASDEVSTFLDNASHPLRDGIELLRRTILSSEYDLTESIKWNGPSYSRGDQDRITMRIHPDTKLQLIFHRGAKVQEQPAERLLNRDPGFLVWKENDRAIASFGSLTEIEQNTEELREVVDHWIEATGG